MKPLNIFNCLEWPNAAKQMVQSKLAYFGIGIVGKKKYFQLLSLTSKIYRVQHYLLCDICLASSKLSASKTRVLLFFFFLLQLLRYSISYYGLILSVFTVNAY